MELSGIDEAVDAVRGGGIVIVVDDPDRENEGDFVMGAEKVTPEAVNFMITHGRGLLCMPLADDRLAELGLRELPSSREHPTRTAFCVSIDHRGAGTGISAPDRAATIRAAADPSSTADDFRRPGHVFPLRARPGGVLERAGHTEAAVDLARLAGLRPAGVICEIMNDDGTMARMPDLVRMSERHGLPLVAVADLIAYRRRHERHVRRVSEACIPTLFGSLRAMCYESTLDGRQHVALVLGRPRGRAGVLARVQAECVLGEVFGSLGCDCGARLRESMRRIAAAGEGVIVYLRGDEAARCGAPDHGTGAQILQDLGPRSVRLMTNEPDEAEALASFGVGIAALVPLRTAPANVTDLTRRLATQPLELCIGEW